MEQRYLRVVGDGRPKRHAALAPAREPLIYHDDDACVGCLGCARYCPAKAIRVTQGRVEVIPEKCVDCGLCVSECGCGAMRVRDDTGNVRRLLAGERPVVALLATEFVAAMHPMKTAELEHALESLGFFAVESTLLGEEIVAEQYEKMHARDNGLFVIRSTCPVVVDWIRRFHPEFVTALAPIVPSYVAQARLTRSLYAEDVAIVYVSPCYARKEEVYDRQFAGAVDACIDFSELRALIDEHDVPLATNEHASLRAAPCREVSLPDGFPRLSLASRSMVDTGVEVVRGLREVERLLRAIHRGETGPQIIDMLNCEGCIDGPAVNPGLSVFAKRSLDTAERDLVGCTAVSTRSMLRLLPAIDVVRSFRPDPMLVPLPDPAAIDALLAEAGFSRDSAPDCRACGHDTCVEQAMAIHRGESTWDMCFPLQRRRLAESLAGAAENATIDPVTAFWTRRAASERLAEEVARGHRHDIPVSLLLVRPDGLDSIAEVDGRDAADTVLGELASAIREELRATDICGRHDDHELSITLPATDKTLAFAVGEKLRERVGKLSVPLSGEGYRERTGRTLRGLTLSVGVATAGKSITDVGELLEAADGALRQSIGGGGDQVRLAPG